MASEPTANVVAVPSVPASSSRTLLWSKAVVVLGVIAGLIPELISLLSDPSVNAAMNEFISPEARRVIALVLAALGVLFHRMRVITAGPIAGTPVEAKLIAETEAAEIAPAKGIGR